MKSLKKAPTSKSAARSSRIQDRRSTGPTEEQIRLWAYESMSSAGRRADGEDLEDWFQAEKELTEIIRKRQSA